MTEEHHGEHHHTEHKHTEHNHTEHEHMGQHHTEHKGHNHAEHEHIDHSTHKSSKVKKATVWKWVSIALGILLITSLYFNFSNKGIGVTGDTVPIDKATDEAVDYINTYLLQPGTTAILNSKSDVGELYKIDIGIDGQQYESYITKDGKMFFTSGIDMTETPDAAPNQPAQPVEVQDVDIGDSASKGKGDANRKNAKGKEGNIELRNVQVGSQARTVSKKFPRKDRPAETKNRQNTNAARIPRAEAVGCKRARMNGASQDFSCRQPVDYTQSQSKVEAAPFRKASGHPEGGSAAGETASSGRRQHAAKGSESRERGVTIMTFQPPHHSQHHSPTIHRA